MESTIKYGFCKFCGQQIELDGGKFVNQDDADAAATWACPCPGAFKMREAEREKAADVQRREKILKETRAEVDKLFIDSDRRIKQSSYPTEVADMLLEAVEWVLDGKIKSITVNAAGKAKISRTAKGEIAIERSDGTSYRSIV